MSIFGWSLPPGCSSLPDDEAHALDLTSRVTLPAGVLGVYWDEDGNLIESFACEHVADPYAGTPAYTDCESRTVGVHPWDDDIGEPHNLALAARAYQRLIEAAS